MQQLRTLAAICALVISSLSAGANEPADFGEPRRLREPAARQVNPLVAQAGLSEFQPTDVSSRLRRTLLQFEALVADEAWSEAIELVERVQTESVGKLTKRSPASASPDGPSGDEVYVPVSVLCQHLLAELPPAGLAAYRDRVDRTASDRTNEAIQRLDSRRLREVTEEFLASASAGEALLALGELALERGDVAAARWHAGRISPLFWGPYGRPAGVTLSLLDPDAGPLRIAEAWREASRPAGLPTAPADDALLAPALTRLILASLREGDLRRAEAECRLLTGIAPDATGRIAGRQQTLAPALRALIDSEWAEDANAVTGVATQEFAWAWDEAIAVQPRTPPQAPRGNLGMQLRINALGQRELFRPQAPSTTSVRPIPFDGVATVGLKAFYVEGAQVKRLDLSTGSVERIDLPGVTSLDEKPTPQPGLGDVAANNIAVRNGVVVARGGVIRMAPGNGLFVNGAPTAAQSFPTLSVAGDRLYVRVVKAVPTRRVRPGIDRRNEALYGIAVGPSGDEPVKFTPPQRDPEAAAGQSPAQFAGPPVVRGDRLYVALATPGARAEIAIACYAKASGRFLWQRELGSGEPIARGTAPGDIALTLAGDTLYAATNLGAVAALEATDGRVRWIGRYARDATPTNRGPTAESSPRPCYVQGDAVIVAPADSERLIAWNAGTGQRLWEAERRESDDTIAGIARSPAGATVVMSGRQITGYDTLTGQRRFRWPESPRSGFRGSGKPAVIGGVVFWPTADAIYALDATTGGLARPPIDLSPVGAAGANLVPTDVGLLVCGPKQLRLLVSLADSANSEPERRVSRLMEDGPRRGPTPRTARLVKP